MRALRPFERPTGAELHHMTDEDLHTAFTAMHLDTATHDDTVDDALASMHLMPPVTLQYTLDQMNFGSMSASEIAQLVNTLPEGVLRLDLRDCSCSEINILDIPKSVRHLTLSNISQAQLTQLITHLPDLLSLEINASSGVTNISELESLTYLSSLTLKNSNNFPRLPNRMISLRNLSTFNCNGFTSLPRLSLYPSLVQLNCQFCNGVKRFPLFSKHHSIRVIDIRHCYGLREIPPVKGEELTKFTCIGVKAKQALYFGSCPKLESVDLSFCRRLLNIVGLHPHTNCPKLSSVKILGLIEHLPVVRMLAAMPRHIFKSIY